MKAPHVSWVGHFEIGDRNEYCNYQFEYVVSRPYGCQRHDLWRRSAVSCIVRIMFWSPRARHTGFYCMGAHWTPLQNTWASQSISNMVQPNPWRWIHIPRWLSQLSPLHLLTRTVQPNGAIHGESSGKTPWIFSQLGGTLPFLKDSASKEMRLSWNCKQEHAWNTPKQ